MSKKTVSMVIKIILFVVVVGAINYFFKDIISLKSIQNSQEVLTQKIHNHPILSSVSFVLFFIITTSLSLPLIGLMCLASGFLFPISWALAMVYFSFFWHCFFMIKLIRNLFKDIIHKRFKEKFKNLYENIQQKGIYYVVFLRLSLVTPSFIINCAAAFTNLNATVYSFASVISSIPILTIFVISGKKLGSINSLTDLYNHTNLIILVSLAIIAFIPVVLQNKKSTN
jgi:uncharacterized membrane protein YdjX (TVP38/TMEM64 family)